MKLNKTRKQIWAKFKKIEIVFVHKKLNKSGTKWSEAICGLIKEKFAEGINQIHKVLLAWELGKKQINTRVRENALFVQGLALAWRGLGKIGRWQLGKTESVGMREKKKVSAVSYIISIKFSIMNANEFMSCLSNRFHEQICLFCCPTTTLVKFFVLHNQAGHSYKVIFLLLL